MAAPHRPTTMARAAVRPRMLVLLVVLLAAAAVCTRLGVWQLDRAQVRNEQAARAEARQAELTAEAPADLADVLPPQTPFTGELLGREVRVSGTYQPDGQLLVTGRVLDGREGVVVLTPLRVAPADGGPVALLPVVRGWVASPDDASAPPGGQVTVTGYLQASEAAGALDEAAGRAESISSAQLVNIWGGPIYAGYLVLADADPAQDDALAPLPPPQPPGGAGWDLRNLGYAVQWWVFGAFAVALWVRLVRDEALSEPAPGQGLPGAEPAADTHEPAEAGPPADASPGAEGGPATGASRTVSRPGGGAGTP